MIFTKPVPFDEAIDSRRVKSILPTTGTTADIKKIAPALRERAIFSARVTNARLLGAIDGMVNQVLNPSRVIDPETGEERPALPGEFMDPATFRVRMTETLKALGFEPDPAVRGTLKDLFSPIRQNLILDMQTKQANNFGYWQQGQERSILDAWPAQELFREEIRNEPRDWFSTWQSNGGQIFGGRMIALKNTPIWTSISAFGVPYPPYDFGSGMGVRDVPRDEAIELGVIDENVSVQPESRDFNEDLAASAPERQSKLFTALEESLEGKAKLVDGVLQFQG